jgi:nucleotide-binding universal stress UspA family protein
MTPVKKQQPVHFKLKPLKKVLIALDYNPTAQKVAEGGFSLAKSMNAEVVLLHVITDPVFYYSSGYSPIMGFNGYMDLNPIQLDSIEGLKSASLEYLNKSKQHLGDKDIKTVVAEGDYATAISKTAKELHADLIVMGSHSSRWLEKILMGSVTEKVLHHTKIPLLIIPTKGSNRK